MKFCRDLNVTEIKILVAQCMTKLAGAPSVFYAYSANEHALPITDF